MSLLKLRRTSLAEITYRRLLSALVRRVKNIPHAVAWNLPTDERRRNKQRLMSYRNLHKGERCFIMGNGPSLAKMDLSDLEIETTFGVNRIYLLFDQLPFTPTYFVSVNDLVIEQSFTEIRDISSPKFINWRYRKLFSGLPDVVFINESFQPSFSRNLTGSVWFGATVTYLNMQIAHYMGFEQVILIGVDHSFSTQGTPNKVVVAGETDQDHFHPKYFADGTRWQLPDLRTSELAYQMAKNAFDKDGREIVDATVGGKLEVFRKVDFEHILQG